MLSKWEQRIDQLSGFQSSLKRLFPLLLPQRVSIHGADGVDWLRGWRIGVVVPGFHGRLLEDGAHQRARRPHHLPALPHLQQRFRNGDAHLLQEHHAGGYDV